MTIEHVSFVNYALAHSGIPPVRRLAISNVGDSALSNVTVRISLLDVSGHSLATPWSRVRSELPVGTPVLFESIELRPDPSALLDLDERQPGTVLVEVSDDEREFRLEERLEVLAHNQWHRDPAAEALSVELLPAFAQPNHPAIAELLKESREILRTRTGSPSTEGYQAGPERADEIAGAICSALQMKEIAYSNPPASWDRAGQKVRSPGQVLDSDRAGTCLDTTVLLAAAFEQAGLHPLLWLLEGHIVVGWWREEHRQLPQIVAQEHGAVVNHLDLDHLRVVETTMLTASAEPVDVRNACRSAARTVRDRELVGVVDVRRARRAGIAPIPSMHRDENGIRVVTVQAPASPAPAPAPPPATPADPRPAAPRATPDVPARVQRWKNALLDLSLRNKLINFSPGASVTRLLIPEGELAQVEDVLHSGGRLALRAADDLDAVQKERGSVTAAQLPDDVLAAGISRRQVHSDLVGDAHGARMRGLQRKARTLREESGSANLYLALGTLEWDLQGRKLRSPLLLLPVTVTPGRRSSEPATLTLDEGAETTPNLCLLEKLRQDLGLELPALAAPPVDEAGIDVAATFRGIREALDAAEMPFAVRETLDLGVLQFATFVLWKDLDEHWSRFAANPLVRHLVESPTEPFHDGVEDITADLDALAATCPVAADSSQLEAVARAEAGRTFVLEGPPGTGKSQTITNILARALASGRRVLFVAEKRAALDVVRTRLNAVGLGALCLDLHDKASRPVAVREHLRRALDATFSPDVEGHRRAHDDVTARGNALARYAGSLHATNAVGHSLYGAHDAVLARGEGPTLPVSHEFVRSTPRDVVETLRRSLPDVADLLWQVCPRRHHAWGFVRGAVDRGRLLHAVSIAHAALREFEAAPPPLRRLIGSAVTPHELHLVAEFAQPGRPPLALIDEVSSGRWQQAATATRSALVQFAQVPRPVLRTATPDALLLPLDDLRADAVAARDGSFLGRKRKLQQVVDRLQPGLQPGTQVDPRTVVELLDDLLALRQEAQGVGMGAGSLPGVGLPSPWNPLRDEVRMLPVKRIDELWRMARRLDGVPTGPFREALRAHLADRSVEDPRWVAPLERLASGITAAAESASVGADAETALESWRDGESLLGAWTADATNRRGDVLERWLELDGLLAPLVEYGSPETAIAALRGDVGADDLVDGFERGLARTSFDERLAHSGLMKFDVHAHQRTIRRFDEASTEVREHLRAVLPRQITQARTSASRTAEGVVRREANKKRGPSVRRLMAQHGKDILAVTPCVLVSPDSLARFVEPTSTPFDLVVFDEASQIRVADAVGALGRAHSAVIVGDSRQMPPTSFGGAGLEDTDPAETEDEDVPEDEESILSECVQARVPQSWLSWHYRSQDEALIAFSNQLYYDGRLASFPAPPRTGTGVSFRRVDGSFQRTGRVDLRTNRTEAQAVVEEVLRRFAEADTPPSLGVVTFNIQQRDLVDELLRATEEPAVLEALDRDDDRSLFIKNLENVQGDERDAVLFSIAFSRNEKGVLPLNFGPLNRSGGERRLNVAVTRARREIVVFCSFDPGDLRDSTAVGIKHLRAYLEMAANGVQASGDVAPAPSATDRHRDDVAAALRDRGLVVHTDVGLSDFRLDITLAHESAPERPLVAVLLDGPGWARRRTVGDRDGMPRVVLEKVLGWPRVERVWLPRWLTARETMVDELAAAVEAAREAAVSVPAELDEADTDLLDGESTAVVDPGPVEAEPDAVAATAIAGLPDSYGGWTPSPLPAEVPRPDPPRPDPVFPPVDATSHDEDGPLVFEPWPARIAGDRSVLDRLDDAAAARQVREVVAEVVAAEAPIELRRLTRLVGGAFGIARVRQVRQDAILDLLPADVRVDQAEGFAWPPHRHRRSWQGYRVSDDPQSRPLAEIPLIEIANAMRGARAQQPDLDWSSDELLRATLAVFGAKRLTDGAWSRLDEARRLARRADG